MFVLIRYTLYLDVHYKLRDSIFKEPSVNNSLSLVAISLYHQYNFLTSYLMVILIVALTELCNSQFLCLHL